MEKPSSYIDWTPNDSVDDAEPRHVVEPSTEKKLAGWTADEEPPHQYFNWFWQRVGDWIRYFDKSVSPYDVTIGAGVDCTHATLEAAVADADVGTNIKVLLRDAIAGGAAAISLTKAGWKIYARPGVTLTKGTATTGLSIEAANIEMHGLRFSGFSTSGDKAVALTAAADYCRIMNCNFASCDTEVDDSAVTAVKKPVVLGNITE